MFRALHILLLTLFLLAPAAEATIVDLVVNGEFETPVVANGRWDHFANVPGWSSGESEIELWAQGFYGSPTQGSDGNPTGQHLELNWRSLNSVSQTFVVPALLNTLAYFSFDAWQRSTSIGSYSVVGSLSGTLASSAINMNSSAWTANTSSFNVMPGETITLTFTALTGNSARSPHIDGVSFSVDAVPEPASYALVGIGLLGLGFYRRRRSHQN